MTEIAQDGLFDMEPTTPVAEPDLPSIEQVVEQVRLQRQEAVAARQNEQLTIDDGSEVAASEQPARKHAGGRNSRQGGAFGGALKRRLEQGEITGEVLFNERDLRALAPLSLSRELFTDSGDQVYAGVVFTPEEFGVITFAPKTLAQRIGNKVLKGSVGRAASERLARKDEVIKARLETQMQRANSALANLYIDEDVFATLAKEIRSPGYAHMGQEDMDALVAHSESVYVSMFEAILTNRAMSTERVKNLTAAMYHLLENPDYRQAFQYRKHLTNLGLDWTRAKMHRLTDVRDRIQNEIDERFGQPA